jgi:multiple sugar transport system permease protein
MGLEKSRGGRIIVYVVLILWTLFALFPLYFSLITSIKSANDVYSITPKFLPWVDYKPTFEAYINMFRKKVTSSEQWTVAGGRLPIIARNSMVAALGGAIGATVLGSLAAYGLARFRFSGWKNEDMGFFLFSSRIFPAIALAVPYFILFNKIRMIDNLFTLILIYTAMNIPLVVWLLWDFFAELPVEIEESALVDGCSRMGAFFRIALPLAAPGIMVAFLFAFVFSWNEFLYAFTLTFNHAKTLPFQIAGNVITRGPRFWDIAAQGTLVMIPPILVALIGGKYIVRGLTLGAVK